MVTYIVCSAAGWIAVVTVAIYALAYVVLDQLEDDGLAYTHALTALLVDTLAVVLLLDGHTLFITLAVEAAVLHLIARRISDWPVAALAHSVFAALGLWFVGRLASAVWNSVFAGQDGTAFLNAWTLAELFALSAAVASSFLLGSGRISSVYRIAAHVGLLALVWREFNLVSDGNAYVTVVWGAYAAGLVVAGLRWDCTLPRQLGLATLFLVVGKLFLIDLVWVGAMWRILLFLGFGGLFLVLSYYLQALWQRGVREGDEGDGPVSPREEG